MDTWQASHAKFGRAIVARCLLNRPVNQGGSPRVIWMHLEER